MKIRSVEVELRTDRQTDVTKLTVTSRNFTNTPKHLPIHSRTQSFHSVLFPSTATAQYRVAHKNVYTC